MRSRGWLCVCAAAIFALACNLASGGEGHGHGHDKDKHGDHDDDRDRHYYRDDDRAAMRGWYGEHHDHLPPGLAKRDRLPPGLERQLVVRGTLPPGLRGKIHRCPIDLERRLPPPPPDCEHVFVGGHVVLVNRKTFVVLDILHFEL
jgi:hypothetical protein